ncbi:MAG: hypothetical protein ACRCY5_02065 [Phocaeicola sp.]
MKNLILSLLMILGCCSCTNKDNETLPLFDFGKGEYEQPFIGILKSEPNWLVKSIQYPPLKWLAPDTLILEKSFIIEFNEEALRSNSKATISFVDSLHQPVEGLHFFCNNTPMLNNSYTIQADSLTKVIHIHCIVSPKFGEKKINGFLIVQGDELDQANSTSLQQEHNQIASWQCEQEFGWPFWLWVAWFILAAFLITVLVYPIYYIIRRINR